MTTNTLLDEKCLNVYRSSSGKRHIEGWFGQTLCGSFIDRVNGWRWCELTSVRYAGRIARNTGNTWCKRCFSNYKDVRID